MEHQNFAGKLHKLTRILTFLSEHRWASDGFGDIKMGHLHALIRLTAGDFNNNQLAENAGMTKQSMNRLTKELLSTGYIKNSEKQSGDGRVKILTLSEKGLSFIDYLNTTRYDLENSLTNVLGINPFTELNQTLNILLDFVEERHKNV